MVDPPRRTKGPLKRVIDHKPTIFLGMHSYEKTQDWADEEGGRWSGAVFTENAHSELETTVPPPGSRESSLPNHFPSARLTDIGAFGVERTTLKPQPSSRELKDK